jgi:hypothetical protein
VLSGRGLYDGRVSLPEKYYGVCDGIGINYNTHTHSYVHTALYVSLTFSLCNKRRGCSWSVFCVSLYTMQFPPALATAVVSVYGVAVLVR